MSVSTCRRTWTGSPHRTERQVVAGAVQQGGEGGLLRARFHSSLPTTYFVDSGLGPARGAREASDEPFLGSIAVAEITTGVIRSWRSALLGNGRSAGEHRTAERAVSLCQPG